MGRGAWPLATWLAVVMTPILPAPPAIGCTLRVPATAAVGAHVPVTLELQNGASTPVAVLSWGTPFEDAWFEPFVQVQRNGHPLAFGGAMVKRGDPEADEYVRLDPRQRRRATLDLTTVFDMTTPGRYVITPRLRLHDVVALPARLPRPRAAHAGQSLTCAAVSVQITSRP
jgi:hypothetical protein